MQNDRSAEKQSWPYQYSNPVKSRAKLVLDCAAGAIGFTGRLLDAKASIYAVAGLHSVPGDLNVLLVCAPAWL